MRKSLRPPGQVSMTALKMYLVGKRVQVMRPQEGEEANAFARRIYAEGFKPILAGSDFDDLPPGYRHNLERIAKVLSGKE